MRKFMVTVRHTDGEWEKLTPTEQAQHGGFLKDFVQALHEKGSELVFFHPPASAKTVRKHGDGTIRVTDGPVEDTHEALGCYYVIETETLEEAVEWAEKGRWMVGVNEVREIFTGPLPG
ncbi:MAG: hypothetical protein JRG76_19930 [Deltaproteobacteria bacterium]|nr:hypothetical protein [Deltaproteobacteria bacterium]